MGVEFDPDDRILPSDGAGLGEQVAFAIVVALGDHGAMQAEEHYVDRHRSAELTEDFVPQPLISFPGNQAGRLGPGGRPLDQGEPLLAGAFAGRDEGRGTESGGLGMLARWGVKCVFESAAVDADRRKRVRFRGQRSDKDPHDLLFPRRAGVVIAGGMRKSARLFFASRRRSKSAGPPRRAIAVAMMSISTA